MNMRYIHNNTIAFLLIICTCLAGCVSMLSGPRKHFEFSVSASGVIEVNGHRLSVTDLPRKLKSERVTADTTIFIAINKNTSISRVSEIMKTLSREGFRKVMVKKPRQAISEIKTP